MALLAGKKKFADPRPDVGSLLSSLRDRLSSTHARSIGDEDLAREVVDLVEIHLMMALAGERMRGASHLGDDVHGRRVTPGGSKLPWRGSILVLDCWGMLVVASTVRGKAILQRAPRGMIRSEMVIAYISTVRDAVEKHVRLSPSTSPRFENLSAALCEFSEAVWRGENAIAANQPR